MASRNNTAALTECPEPKKCIWETSIGEAPHAGNLKKMLIVLLEPPRQLGGDIKSLACAFGYTGDEINFLTRPYGSATEDLLNFQGHHNIKYLLDKLCSIKREDAAGQVRKYVRSQNCECEDCKKNLC